MIAKVFDIYVTERGWPGHFCAAAHCQFHRNTLLEKDDIRIVVSTVGNYQPPHSKKYETIGFDRYGETMAFHARWNDPYWDADVRPSRTLSFDSDWCDSLLPDRLSDNRLDKMHEAVVEEIVQKLIDGEIEQPKEDTEE